MSKLQNLLSRSKGFATYAGVGLATVAPFANAAESDILTGLAITTAVAGVFAAATLKGGLRMATMGAKAVLGMLR